MTEMSINTESINAMVIRLLSIIDVHHGVFVWSYPFSLEYATFRVFVLFDDTDNGSRGF